MDDVRKKYIEDINYFIDTLEDSLKYYKKIFYVIFGVGLILLFVFIGYAWSNNIQDFDKDLITKFLPLIFIPCIILFLTKQPIEMYDNIRSRIKWWKKHRSIISEEAPNSNAFKNSVKTINDNLRDGIKK